eukprot:TRINITY_DN14697_c0_g1_i2.p1 TRINITY_DN14697_c0_g1~~TRINITY_DN14697_c0_g1_i2.p1  ORF type:complete len:197 (-),score=50.82 TRINITY_DN14697_c0_g1_i2:165-755(-)
MCIRDRYLIMKRKYEENNVYDVEAILEKKCEAGVALYKVKWAGFPVKDATWEPLENLKTVEWMVKRFDKQLKSTTFNRYDASTISPRKTAEKSNKRPLRQITYEDLGLAETKTSSTKLQLSKFYPVFIENKPSLVFDMPRRILTVMRDEKGLKAQIQWEPRENGLALAETWHYTGELRKHEKMAKMLLNYYESIVE